MMDIREFIWNKTLRRPYRLAVRIDRGRGQTLVLLHGLGARSTDWDPVLPYIDLQSYRVIALDLLGFGESPKPVWKDYRVDDHAQAVMAALKRLRIKKPYILVGHSMGAVVAARIARLDQKNIKLLVLYQIPVYSDLPEQNARDIRNKAYLSFVKTAAGNPERTMRLLRFLGRVASDFVSISLDSASWPPFERSLTNTVMGDSVYEDLRYLSINTEIIHGRFDVIVIKRLIKKLFKTSPNIRFRQVNEGHRITSRTGAMLAKILAAHKE